MSSENDIAEQLSKLAKLHADGALSDDEFKALKAKLLSNVSGNNEEARDQPFAAADSSLSGHDQKSRKISNLVSNAIYVLLGLGGLYAFVVLVVIPSGLNEEFIKSRLQALERHAHFDNNLVGPNLKVQAGLGQIAITNVDTKPVTIESININDGGCKAIVRGGHNIRNPNYVAEPIQFEQRVIRNGSYEVLRPGESSPFPGKWCAVVPMTRLPPSTTPQEFQRYEAEHWRTGHFPCFDHYPTRAEIEANDPGHGGGPPKELWVEEDKVFGNVTLVVGQSVATAFQCPQGVDVVRLTVYTDKGSRTFSHDNE